MPRNRDYYRYEDDDPVIWINFEKKPYTNSNHKIAQECKKKRRKADQQRRKANLRLKMRIRNQNDQFIRSWSPENVIDG